jgi:hypothetical protein
LFEWAARRRYLPKSASGFSAAEDRKMMDCGDGNISDKRGLIEEGSE